MRPWNLLDDVGFILFALPGLYWLMRVFARDRT